MRFHFALILGTALSLSCSFPVALGQDRESPPPSGSQKSSQEVLDEFPEGETLPDMPEPETLLPSGAVPGYPRTAPAPGPNYVIGPEDVLEIDVFNVLELKRAVRVGNDGTISLPLISRVKAAGLTADQLREELERRYSESYLENPQINVFVSEFHAQPVSVIGAVEKPNLYQLTGPRTLIEMLSMAGGLAKRASAPAGRNLYVTRRGGFGDLPIGDGMQLVAPDKLEINIQRLLYARDAALNIEIHPRDTISVSKADIVYVVGSVRKAGGFVLEDQEKVTVLQALAMAEGFSGSPAKGSTRIIHRDEDGTRTEIAVDLNKVMKGQALDVELAANDILFIPESGGKMAAKRGMEAAISTITGVIIWRRP